MNKELLDLLKAAQANPLNGMLNKAWTQASGLVNYDLTAPAYYLVPWGEEMTPLRNSITRVQSNNGDTATRWKSIVAINANNMPFGVSEGNRSGIIATTLTNSLASYAGLGSEDYVTFEADYADQGFDDAKARASAGTLRTLMMGEESMIYGGNSSVALGTTPTPTLTQAAAGGALSDGTFKVVCVALTHDGWRRASVAGGVTQVISRTNADGSTDQIGGGTAIPSAVATITLNGGGAVEVIKAVVAPVVGAVAYAWYMGPDITHQYLSQITTINSALITATPANTFQNANSLAATDYSTVGSYGFDGLLYQSPFKAGTGAYFLNMPNGTLGTGTPLTSDGAGGIVEINTAFKAFYDNYRLSPDTMWCNSQEVINISNKVIANGGAPLVRFVMDANGGGQPSVSAGAVVGSYYNKVTGQLCKIRVHPFAAPGLILFTSKTIPYPQSGISTVAQIKTRKEYYQTDWPLRTRKFEYGCYVDEVLQVLFNPAFGAIGNIGNG